MRNYKMGEGVREKNNVCKEGGVKNFSCQTPPPPPVLFFFVLDDEPTMVLLKLMFWCWILL